MDIRLPLTAPVFLFAEPLSESHLDWWHSLDASEMLDDDPPPRASLILEFQSREGLEAHLRSEMNAVRATIDAVNSPQALAARAHNRQLMGYPDVMGDPRLDRLAAAVSALILHLRHETGPYTNTSTDLGGEAGIAILESAHTTLSAISLLIACGYSGEAYARWRGFHELACSSLFLATSTRRSEILERFLAHARLLSRRHPAYRQDWALHPDFFKNYGWIRADSLFAAPKGIISQRWIFQTAPTTVADFEPWIALSHAQVHLSSVAVASSSMQAGIAPAGHNVELSNDVVLLTAMSFLELIESCCYFTFDERRTPESSCAWALATHQYVEEVMQPRLRAVAASGKAWIPPSPRFRFD